MATPERVVAVNEALMGRGYANMEAYIGRVLDVDDELHSEEVVAWGAFVGDALDECSETPEEPTRPPLDGAAGPWEPLYRKRSR